MKKTILITGGAGYIGGRLLEYFIQNPDCKVRIADRTDVLQKTSFPQNTDTVPIDLVSEESLDHACRGADAVIHLAALNEIDSAKYPDRAWDVNTAGTLRLLRACAKNGVKRLLYFSTAHVYGAPLDGMIEEKRVPRPVHPYASTHKAAEDIVNEYHDKNILAGVIVRLSNSFGYPFYKSVDRWTLVANDLCRQAVTEKKLRLKSSGIQKRDFITLTDVCRAAEHLLILDREFGKENIFNVGGSNSLSVFDMAKLVARACRETLGFEPPIERPAPQRGDNPGTLHYRISRLLATGFRLKGVPETEIRETLLRCRDWFGDADGAK